MKMLVALALVSLLAASAFAGLDPDPDMMGLYFDDMGMTVCTTANFIDHVPAYILYTNPTIATTRGFECGITVVGRTNTSVSVTYPTAATDVGAADGNTFNYIAGYAAPMPTSEVTVLATLDIFYLDTNPLDFFLGPATPSSDPNGMYPMVMLDDFSLMTVGTSTDGGVSAQINAPECMVVDNEDASFGAVKALFR